MAGRKTFTAGEVLQAADVNDFLMDQSVMVFAGTAARGSAIPSPTEGMVTYRSDDDVVEVYNGASFVPVGPGQILQVVSIAKTDTFTSSSTSFTDVTGLQASITPSSTSSKILVLAQVSVGVTSTGGNDIGLQLRLTGGNSGTYIGDASGSETRAVLGINSQGTGAANYNMSGSHESETIVYLDSPSTLSATTYKVQIRANVGNVHVNRSGQSIGTAPYARGASSITLMEVAG